MTFQLNVEKGGEKVNISKLCISFLGMLLGMCSINNNNNDNKALTEMMRESFNRTWLVCSLQCLAVTLNQTGMYQLVATL